ncbi:unnamed protein product, partial [Closterium sp. NIES-53]
TTTVTTTTGATTTAAATATTNQPCHAPVTRLPSGTRDKLGKPMAARVLLHSCEPRHPCPPSTSSSPPHLTLPTALRSPCLLSSPDLLLSPSSTSSSSPPPLLPTLQCSAGAWQRITLCPLFLFSHPPTPNQCFAGAWQRMSCGVLRASQLTPTAPSFPLPFVFPSSFSSSHPPVFRWRMASHDVWQLRDLVACTNCTFIPPPLRSPPHTPQCSGGAWQGMTCGSSGI